MKDESGTAMRSGRSSFNFHPSAFIHHLIADSHD
jgi:hypothetical protein